MQNGSIYTFHAGSCITALNFPPSLLETSEAAAEASFRTCTAGAGHLAMQLQGCQQSMDLMQHIAALTERFFVVNLLPAGAYSPSSSDFSPLIPSVYAATRHDFVMLCQKANPSPPLPLTLTLLLSLPDQLRACASRLQSGPLASAGA